MSPPRAKLVRPAALALAAALCSSAALAADPPITEEARMHFSAGVNLLRDPDGARYEEAYREFKAAYAASPSYKILGNLGLCAMKLERDGEAIDAYASYLTHASDLDPTEAKQVQTDLLTLKAGVVKVALSIEPGGATVNDVRVPVRGERVTNQYGPTTGPLSIGIRAGHHIITVRAAGMEDATWELDAPAGASETKRITLHKAITGAPPSSPAGTTKDVGVASSRPVPAGVYVGLAVTGALAIGGAVTGAMALGKHSDFNTQNDGLHMQAAQDLHDQGTKLNLITDIFFGGAVVAAGITTVLFVSRPAAAMTATEPSLIRVAGVRATPEIGISPEGSVAGLRGSF
jgi:hypothetical protein